MTINSTANSTARFASLPWYDLDEVSSATNELWRRLAANLGRRGLQGVPRTLERSIPFSSQWTSRRLLLGQACGYDVLLTYPRELRVLATPRYSAPGCRGALYRSLVMVREDSPAGQLRDLRGCRCVLNSATSHSGMNILRALVAPYHRQGRFFARILTSGSHRLSLRWLRRRLADVAAIDCVTHALLERYYPRELAGLRILCETPAVAAPPFVTSSATRPEDVRRLRAALAETLDDPRLSGAKARLMLDGVETSTRETYRPIADLVRFSCDLGYREMPLSGLTPLSSSRAPGIPAAPHTTASSLAA